MKIYYRLVILFFLFIESIFSQCNNLSFDESNYYYNSQIDINHINSVNNCFYLNDWNILDSLILINNLQNLSVENLGVQNWDENGRLTNLIINYSSSTSSQYIDQKITQLPENFGELTYLQSLELFYHDLTVFPTSFPNLQNLSAIYMKGNKLKILNPNFGDLSQLQVLDLGYNELVELPESISELQNVEYFWIFGNELSFIPDSICELDIDWSGESGDFIYFGSGGNNLCENIPSCIESSSFFNIMLEEEGYAFQIQSEQVCLCDDGSYPDCAGQCSVDEDYGSIIDGCGVCALPSEVCSMDCNGSWGGSAEIDECGVCNGDGGNCEEYGTVSISNIDNINYVIYNSPQTNDWDISGFQFYVDGTNDFIIEGGISEQLGFNISISNNLVLGFSFTGTIIPAGSDTLLVIIAEQEISGLSNIVFSDTSQPAAQSLNFLFDDGNLDICEQEYDCLGVCGGNAIIDECGKCDGSGATTWFFDADGDGLGDPNNATSLCYPMTGFVSNSLDENDFEFCPYQLLGNNFDCESNCLVNIDCNGLCGGSDIYDSCGVCGGDDSTCSDCAGIPNGSSNVDYCGACVVQDDTSCVQGCDGNYANDGTHLVYDECEVCGGDNSTCTDCNNDLNGSAQIDGCGECVGGNTGQEACAIDCSGNSGGFAALNGCGECICNGEVAQDGFSCVESQECILGCDGLYYNVIGNAPFDDDCGVCGGDNSTCNDCAGIPNGTSVIDNCGACVVEDDTSCILGCDGNYSNDGLHAVFDECGVCSGGESGYIYNSNLDCNGDCFGEALESECGCYGGNTGLSADFCFGCTDFNASNYCEECTILCNYTNSCCEYNDLSVGADLIPQQYAIIDNYPNPFNPSTIINYSIPTVSHISLAIYDINGKLVTNLIDEVHQKGFYSVSWNGTNDYGFFVTSGIYFTILESGTEQHIHKILLVK